VAEASPVRPTKRALSDLRVEIPMIDVRLSDLEHPLIVRAQAMPDMVAANSVERILSLTDRVWLKVKTCAWRGATGRLGRLPRRRQPLPSRSRRHIDQDERGNRLWASG
jgi:hypothetical protein